MGRKARYSAEEKISAVQEYLDGKGSMKTIAQRLGITFGNLVKNALDHTEIGGIVKITWESTPTMIRILVSDNGSGIAPEDIHHIFKRFYRSKYSLNTPGIVLGLPLAKSIIEGQEGLISVQSVLHEGTTFSVSFLTKS